MNLKDNLVLEDVDSFSGTTTGILKYQSSPYSVSNLAATGSVIIFWDNLTHIKVIKCSLDTKKF